MKITLIAGDTRQRLLAELLRQRGFKVRTFRVPGTQNDCSSLAEACFDTAAVVLPLPMGKGAAVSAPQGSLPLADIISATPCRALLLGGAPDREAVLLSNALSCPIVDYYTESLRIMNAVPTAEGALALAMQHTAGTVFGADALVCGFGVCGRRLALLLKAVGARVTVAARSPAARALAESLGFSAVSISGLAGTDMRYHMLFNTVPARVLGLRELEKLLPGAPYIELASGAGGADPAAAKALGVNLIIARSLPGTAAPQAAAEYILAQLMEIFEQRGITSGS